MLLRTLIVCVVTAALAASATAEKITVDPNMPEARAALEQPAIDERVAQKVTYEAKRKPVSQILEGLTELTRVKLYAGYNSKDWQVRDRRTNIFARDVPLGHLMNSIARVMKFQRSINEDADPPTYRLFMDRKTLLSAENKRLREEAEAERKRVEDTKQMLIEFGKMGNLSEDELSALRDENPYLYVLATTGVGASLGTLFTEIPAAAEAAASGQSLTLSGQSFSPEAQEAALNAAQALAELGSMMEVAATSEPFEQPDSLEDVTIELNPHREIFESMPGPNITLCDIWIDYEYDDHPRSYIGILMNPESSIVKHFGKMLLRSREEGRPLEDVLAEEDQGGEFESLMSETTGQESGEPLIEHPDDPALDEKIKLEPDGRGLHEVQSALAAATDWTVVSDWFEPSYGYAAAESEERPIRDALESISTAYYYNWERRGSIIEFRDRYWYKKRAAQIPQAWIDGWAEALERTGTLDLPDLAQIAGLSYEQFMANIEPDERLRGSALISVLFSNSRELLRVYGSLSESQRAWLFTERGLDLASLTPGQWERVRKLVNARDSTFLENPEARLRLKAERTQHKKAFTYRFALSTTDGLDPISWYVFSPEYKEPEEEAEKAAS